LVIVDLDLKVKYIVIKSTEPQKYIEHFTNQINLIKGATQEEMSRQTIVVGDFNLDDSRK
jgi:hypothetical protein